MWALKVPRVPRLSIPSANIKNPNFPNLVKYPNSVDFPNLDLKNLNKFRSYHGSVILNKKTKVKLSKKQKEKLKSTNIEDEEDEIKLEVDDTKLVREEEIEKPREPIFDPNLIKDSNSPLKKFLLQEPNEESKEISRMMAEMREKYPEQAKLADEKMKELSTQDILKIIQKEYPEFSENQTDLQIFQFFKQFLGEDSITGDLQEIEENLKKEEEKKKIDREVEILKEEAKAKLLSHIAPEYYDNPELNSDKYLKKTDIPISDPKFSPPNLEGEKLLLEQADEIFRSKEENFIEYLKKTAPGQEMERMEKLYEEYQKISQHKDRVYTNEIVDSATNFKQIFTPEFIGKFYQIPQREQKKFIPEGWCGKLEQREFERTKETSLMMRKPVLDIIQRISTASSANFVSELNKPLVLYGDEGVGKSAVIQQVVYWARKNNWLVINIKSGLKWVHSAGILQKSKILPGCWDQPHLGVRFLSTVLDAHSDKLKQIPLRTKFQMGKFDGKTLYDLVEYGAALHEYSCDAVFYLKNELQRVIEFPVLVTIDDYNLLYNYNQVYRDPECPRFKPRKLQNKFLTLTHTFYDMHKNFNLINGAFVASLTRENCGPKFPAPNSNAPNCEWMEIPRYSIDELHRVFNHYERTKFVAAKTSINTREIIYQLCDGRGTQLSKYCLSI